MKIMFYALRPFDEQQYCEPYKAPVSYKQLTLPTN